MAVIKVGDLGAEGRMGSLVCQAVRSATDLALSAEIDASDSRDPLAGCDVVVGFTSPAAVMANLAWCARHGRDMVIGTAGFDDARLAEVSELLRANPEPGKPRVLVVPNFSIGAVLMMRFAQQAARHFESAEMVELHHAGKVDAPSGTATRTAVMIAAARAAAGLGPSPDATVTTRLARGVRWQTACTCTRCRSLGWSRTKKCCSAGTARH